MEKDKVVVIEGEAKDWKAAIGLTGKTLYELGYVKDTFVDACITREKTFPTGLEMETSIAIPHTDDVHVNEASICVLRLKNPVEFCRMDDPEAQVSTDLICNLALPKGGNQIQMLQKMIAVASDSTFRNQYKDCTLEELKEMFNQLLFEA